MLAPYLLLFVILCFYVYLFIGIATQPYPAVRISNNRCCQNCLAQGTNSTENTCLATMHWELSQGLGRVIAHNYQESIGSCNDKQILS